ncbi:MAG: hypothetical protein AABX89_01315 [Candidatus Thermoplasmatota archaeon]
MGLAQRFSGVVGWLAVVLFAIGAFAGLEFLLALSLFGFLPGGLILLILLRRGPSGLPSSRNVALAVWATVYAVALAVFLFAPHTSARDAVHPFATAAMLVGLAERAWAYGRRDWLEGLLGALAAQAAFIAFFVVPSAPLPAVTFTLAAALLAAVHIVPLRRATRWAAAVGVVPFAWKLDLFLAGIPLRIAEVAVVGAVLAALVWSERQVSQQERKSPKNPPLHVENG